MRIISTILFILLLCIFAQAQENSENQASKKPSGGFTLEPAQCGGNGAAPSHWDVIRGKVVSVIDSDTVIVESNAKNHLVDLIGIDASLTESKATLFLQNTVLNQRVNVFVKDGDGEKLQVSGIIHLFEPTQIINEYLIINGLAKYRKIKDGELTDSGTTDCNYKILEEKAKEKKSGIWSK